MKKFEEVENFGEFLSREGSKTTRKRKYNPKDNLGDRLGRNWRNGDTVWSASFNMFYGMVYELYNPRNYNLGRLRGVRDDFKDRRNIIIAQSLIALPILGFYFFYRKMRINKTRNEFYLNQQLKRAFISNELGVKTRKMRLRELKKIVRESAEE